MPSECQTVWIQITPDIMSGLIWFQTVCKRYQQRTLGGEELKKFLQEHYQSVKRFDPDQAQCSIGPDLGPNRLQGR